MTRDHIVTRRDPSTALATPLDLAGTAERARTTMEAADAPNTRRTYEWLWRNFEAWCDAASVSAVPAQPEAVAMFLQHLVDRGYARATVLAHRTAIARAHTAAGLDAPTRAHVVRTMIRGILKTSAPHVNQKDPLRAEHVAAMLPDGTGPAALRDRALLLVGLAGGFRRSELAAIDRGHLSWSRRGVLVHVPRSKTDQSGVGADVGILYARHDARLCAPTALREWLDHLDVTDAGHAPLPYVFRPITKAGGVRDRRLTPESINRIVQGHAERAKVTVDLDVGAHSLRSGMATELATRGAKLEELAKHGRWKSLEMVLRYYRPATALEASPSGLF